MTSRGREFLAVLQMGQLQPIIEGGREGVEPGVGDDDVVDGGVTPSEARQPQFDDHYCRIWG